MAEKTGKQVQVLCNEVPKSWAMEDAYCQLIPCNDNARAAYNMIPRIGAFEISHKGVLVFSKLLMAVWPDVPGVAEKLRKMLEDSNNGMS